MKEFQLYDDRIVVSDELKRYCEYLILIKNKCSDVISKLNNFAADHIDAKDILTFLQDDFDQSIKSFISLLAQQGIFDVTKNDFLTSNHGYLETLEHTLNYYKNAERIENTQNSIAESELINAEIAANSEIQGMGFGVITDSIFGGLLYAAMSDSVLREQQEKAQAKYDELSKNIHESKHSQIKFENSQYCYNTYIPNVVQSIGKFYGELLDEFICVLSKNGKFDISSLEKIDIKRSSELLENCKVIEDKKSVIFNAIKACPFNIDIYVYALVNGFYCPELDSIQKYFELNDEIVKSLYAEIDKEKIVSMPIVKSYELYEAVFKALIAITFKEENVLLLGVYQTKISAILKQIKALYKVLQIEHKLYIENVLEDKKNWENWNDEQVKQYIDNRVDAIISEEDFDMICNKLKYNSFLDELWSTLHEKITDYDDLVQFFEQSFSKYFTLLSSEKKEKDLRESDYRIKENNRRTRNLRLLAVAGALFVLSILVIIMTDSTEFGPYAFSICCIIASGGIFIGVLISEYA